MFKLTLILLFISSSVFSQTFGDANTLIFYFDEENGNRINKTNGGTFEKISYIFQLDDDGEDGKKYLNNNSVTLQYRVFDDFDAMDKNDSTLVFVVDKSFLKKNKDFIITKDHLNRMNKKILFEKLDNNNKLFLISKSEIKDGKLAIRQVFYTYIPRI